MRKVFIIVTFLMAFSTLKAEADALKGEKLFKDLCTSCHNIRKKTHRPRTKRR